MNTIFHQLFQHNRFLTKELNEVLAKHGLYLAQWTLLFILSERGAMSLTSIWKYLNVEAPTVTRTVTRLEQMGYVEKLAGEDRREKIIQLTPHAESKLPAIVQDVKVFEEKMLRRLNEQDITQLEKILQKMKGDEAWK